MPLDKSICYYRVMYCRYSWLVLSKKRCYLWDKGRRMYISWTILTPFYWFLGCLPGTYQDEEGKASCKECPAGYYCYANSTTYSENVCPVGHYCPPGTPDPRHKPCQPSTYNPKPGANSSLDCLPCTQGEYCAGYGNYKPTNSCDPGWYCPGGNDVSQPSGNRCQRRYYCPRGSHNMSFCLPGMYCDQEELDYPSGKCDPGYYCPLGSESRQEKKCPPGRYCPLGSPVPEPCLPGYYLPGEKHQNKSECQECIAGMYCNKSGLPYPDGDCDKGYYCPPGQSVSRPAAWPCPVGHYCQVQSPEPTRCPNGTYQDERYQHVCKDCLAGYYCDNTDHAVSNLTDFWCPPGHYCPEKTSFSTQHKCPPGTWSNKTRLVEAGQCTSCPPRYCVYRHFWTTHQSWSNGQIQDITWPRGDTNFIVLLKFVSPSGHVMFCLLYRFRWNLQNKDASFIDWYDSSHGNSISSLCAMKISLFRHRRNPGISSLSI